MNYKLFLLLISLFSVVSSVAQTAPDMDRVVSEITNTGSQYYYPRLMARYQKNDTTLTLTDYHYLYYGYPEQPDYRPLLSTNYVDSLSMVFSSRKIATGDEFSKIERYCKAILSVEPFNLRDINVLAYAYQHIGYKDKAAEQMYKLKKIAQTIRATGTGLTQESPWWIIYQDHAPDLLNLMDAEPSRCLIVNSTIEFYSCAKTPEKKIKGYYFNYSEIYKRKPTYLEGIDKPKRKLNIKPKTNEKYELTK